MWVRMKRNGSSGSNIRFKQITEEIRQQWDDEDKKDREDHRRDRSQTPRRYDSFAGQWLSFAAGRMDYAEDSEGGQSYGGGVVDAFTGENRSLPGWSFLGFGWQVVRVVETKSGMVHKK